MDVRPENGTYEPPPVNIGAEQFRQKNTIVTGPGVAWLPPYYQVRGCHPPHSKPTAYVAGRLGPWVAMVAADPNYSEPMIAWGDTEEVDVDSSRVTKFKGASGSSKLLLQCRRSRHVFGAVWSVVSVSQSVAGTQCSGP